MGDRVSMSEVEKILESTQIDDGEIYYEDFIKLLTKNWIIILWNLLISELKLIVPWENLDEVDQYVLQIQNKVYWMTQNI